MKQKIKSKRNFDDEVFVSNVKDFEREDLLPFLDGLRQKFSNRFYPSNESVPQYEQNQESPFRVRFERNTGSIYVNTLESSVQLYFGANGEGQEQAANQCLVAELVTQIACEEIARVSREKGSLVIPPGIKELDAFYNYLNKLRIQNAGLIHKLLVNAKYRRQ
jgi:hypothetical protein